MDELLEQAVRDVEELTASVDFDTSEITEEELAALPSLENELEDPDEEDPEGAVYSKSEEPSPPNSTGAAAALPSTTMHGAAWLDRALNAINRPFESIAPATRRWIGLIAAVTLATALLFAILRPLLFARYDVVGALRASTQSVTQDNSPDD